MIDDERERERGEGLAVSGSFAVAETMASEERQPTVPASGELPPRRQETAAIGHLDTQATDPPGPFPELDGADDRRMEDMIAARLFPKRLKPVTISGYTILDRLGRGGMGVVYAAYDPQLDRKVAIKLLLSEHLSINAEARLRREAKAMAMVVHANVVSVIEVGDHEGRTYVVMEYIRGRSLSTWLERQPNWRESLAVYLQAGQGLAAAHRAGVIHRDFKPHNAMLVEEGTDAGRVKVLDFGLAQGAAVSSSTIAGADAQAMESLGRGEAEGSSAFAQRLTATGALLGTPAYMAPEQFSGAPATALSDQYSFTVSLYEALYGRLPFSGASLPALMSATLNGAPAPPPSATDVPKWVHRVLLRGLARDPADRFPSVEALCEALTRDPSARRRSVGLAIALSAVVGASAWGLATLGDPVSPCRGPSFELGEVWSDERAAALQASFAATEAPLAEESAGRVSKLLDRYASEWSSTRVEACEAHRLGESSAKLLDLGMACLDRRRAGLLALADLFVEADGGIVARATEAALALPPLSACADVEALLEASPRPEDPEQAEQVQRLGEELASITALASGGLLDVAARRGAELLARATPLGHLPLTAEVSLELGRIELDRGRPEAADVALSGAVGASLEAGVDRIAAEALLRRLFVRGGLLGDVSGAAADEAIATPLTERYADDPHLRWLLLNNLGAVRLRQGELDVAEGLLLQAKAMEVGPSPIEAAGTLANLARIASDHRDFEAALEGYRRARILISEQLGREHPLVVAFRVLEASVLVELGRHEEAEVELRALLDRPGADTSAHLGAWPRINLSSLEHLRRRDGVARRLAEEAIALLGETDPYALAYAEIALARALAGLGEAEAAREHRRRGIAIAESSFGAGAVRLMVVISAGQEAGRYGERDAVIEDLRRALLGCEASFGPRHPMTALGQRILADALLTGAAPADRDEALALATSATTTLRSLDRAAAIDLGNAELTRGRALLGAGEPAAAIVSLQESLVQLDPRLDGDNPRLAELCVLLAQALHQAGRDGADGVSLGVLLDRAEAAYRSLGVAFEPERAALGELRARLDG